MADQNQSGNNRAPNTLAELGASRMPSSIGRTLENVSPENTQRYQRLTEQIGRIQENKLFQLGQQDPMLLTEPNAAKQYRGMEARRASYMRQQEIMEEAAAQRANRMVGTSINQSFSSGSINGQIASRLESTGAQQEALRIASQVAPERLLGRIKRSEARMQRYGAEAAGIEPVNRFGERDPEAEERLQQLFGLREIEMNRRAGMVGAARIQRRQGLDPESRMDALVNMADRAKDIVAAQRPEIRNLSSLSANEFKKREFEAAERLSKAFDKLAQVTDSTSDEFKNLKEEVDDAEKQFKDIQSARGGGGGGGGPGGWQIAAAGLNAGAMAIQQIGVNQRLAQMSNISGYANFQNDIYSTYKQANAGDVASLMLLPQFQAAEDFGGQVRTAANLAVGARGAAGVAQVGVGLTEAGALANPLNDIVNTSGAAAGLKAGAGDLIAGTATTAEAWMDLNRGVSERQADIQARQARIAVARSVQQVSAEQLQGFRDYSVGLGVAAQGMGGGGEAFLRSTATAAQLDRLSAARISPEQFAQLAQQGVNSMGGGFDQGQIFAARALERRGLGSIQTNLERQSQLYAAGANNPQEGLGRILEQAIPKGFDNSKLVGQLVQYSSQMAMQAGGVATGLNLTGATANLLTAGIGPGTQNKEAMLQHAADVAGVFRNAETNVSTSYSGMVNVARMQRGMGRGGIDAVIAGGADTATLMAIRDEKDPLKRAQALQLAGLSEDTSAKELNSIIQNKRRANFSTSAGLITNANADKLIGDIDKSGTVWDLNKQDRDTLRRQAGLETLNSGKTVTMQDIFAREKGIAASGPTGTGAGVFTDKNVGSLQKSMDDLRTQGFVQLSSAASAAAKSLDPLVKSTGAIEKLALAFKQVEGTITATEKAAPTAAARAAQGGAGFDTTQWDNAAKKLNMILDRIITKQGGSPIPTQRSEMPQ